MAKSDCGCDSSIQSGVLDTGSDINDLDGVDGLSAVEREYDKENANQRKLVKGDNERGSNNIPGASLTPESLIGGVSRDASSALFLGPANCSEVAIPVGSAKFRKIIFNIKKKDRLPDIILEEIMTEKDAHFSTVGAVARAKSTEEVLEKKAQGHEKRRLVHCWNGGWSHTSFLGMYEPILRWERTGVGTGAGTVTVTTMDKLRHFFSALDGRFGQIEAILMLGESTRWETSLKLLIDVLLTNDHPYAPSRSRVKSHLLILACKMDVQWMPRFGNGAFLLCLGSLYKKVTDNVCTEGVSKDFEIDTDLTVEPALKAIFARLDITNEMLQFEVEGEFLT